MGNLRRNLFFFYEDKFFTFKSSKSFFYKKIILYFLTHVFQCIEMCRFYTSKSLSFLLLSIIYKGSFFLADCYYQLIAFRQYTIYMNYTNCVTILTVLVTSFVDVTGVNSITLLLPPEKVCKTQSPSVSSRYTHPDGEG